MKIKKLILLSVLFFGLMGCNESEEPDEWIVVKPPFISYGEPSITIDGINVYNFPVIDGSESTESLRTIIACNLLRLDYQWERKVAYDLTWKATPNYSKLSDEESDIMVGDKLNNSNTHGSFINLIDGTVDLIVTAREISRDEKVYAQEKGVTLLQTPIAKDAFIFIVSIENPITTLSISQIQGIYMGEIRNWSEVGGEDAEISPFVRNANSGSQEKMETMVMAGLDMPEWPEMNIGVGMMAPYRQLAGDVNGIGYTPFYYYDVVVDEPLINVVITKSIAVNGIAPSKETIIDGTYPYITEVYVAVRSDIDRNSMAYKLYEALVNSGSAVVEESGYVPIDR